jgi:hypothetical protein
VVTCTKVSHVPENTAPLPDFTRWPSFPFEGDMRIKTLASPVEVEPPRSGEDAGECVACNTPDDAYIWVSERWRVRAMDRPTGLPMVLILECRSHLDLGDLPNLLAAELGVMTVRLERAIRSLDGVARVHVNRWGDGSAHLHMWFLARPYGRLQLRGTFLSLWDDILPVIPEQQWRENLALVAAWLAEFGGSANAEPPHIQWQSPSRIMDSPVVQAPETSSDDRPTSLGDIEGSMADSESDSATVTDAETQDLVGSSERADALHAQRVAEQREQSGTSAVEWPASPSAGQSAGFGSDWGSGTARSAGSQAAGSGEQSSGDAESRPSGGRPADDADAERGTADRAGKPMVIAQRSGDEPEVAAPSDADDAVPEGGRKTEPSVRP